MSHQYFTLRRIIGLILAITLPTAIWLMPTPEGLSPIGQKAISVTVLAIVLWVSELIRPELTGLLIMVLFTALGIAPVEKSFGGFLTSAVWLSFAGFVIGAGMIQSGLGQRISTAISRLFGASYTSSVIGISTLGFLLAFVMPTAIARVTITVPIAITIGKKLGYVPHSKGMAGLTLASVCSTGYPTTAILSGGLPALTLHGLIEALLGKHITWSEWLIRFLPTHGLLTLLGVIAVTIMAFKPEVTLQQTETKDKSSPSKPFTNIEKRMLIYLAASLILWSTDFVHGVNAAWIGLLVAVLVTLPKIGIFRFEEMASKVNFPSLFYIAGAIGLGGVLQSSGFASWAAGSIFNLFDIAHMEPFTKAYALSLVTTVTQLFSSSGITAVAIVTPMIIAEASRSNLEPISHLLIQIPAVNTAFLPYEAIPMVIAYGYNMFTTSQAIRMMLLLSVITLVVVIPSTVAYWMFTGFWK
ncbi:MAG: anion permease [Thaumarchaeota archaeon]|nr:anion permease [Nitrososphaerota archaeon]